jgi:putative ATP-dependent endonuclease of the OLD family
MTSGTTNQPTNNSEMYVAELKLWNFRKYGSSGNLMINDNELRRSDLTVALNPGLNLFLGENDSGKSAIVDALKFILKTHSTDWIKIEEEDFYRNSNRLRIEVKLQGLTDNEAKNFIEWLGMEGTGTDAKPFLRLILDVSKTPNKILPSEVRAGLDDEGFPLTAEAKEFLKVVYLKPLRDAAGELISRKNSRLSQILRGHEAFKGREENHYLKTLIDKANLQVEKYFDGIKVKEDGQEEVLADEQHGKELQENINNILSSFFRSSDTKSSNFSITGKELSNILDSLKLGLNDDWSGLGSHNLLFIAAELILLKRQNWEGIRLGLVEEMEAHLHPQAQIRVMKYLEDLCCNTVNNFQLVLTSHSPNLASVVSLESIFICKDGKVHSLAKGKTKLEGGDYKFMERFLDVTKSNFFFSRGVILVEGYAENILLPTIAEKIGKDLKKHGVAIVNVGSTAYLRYAKIFIDHNNKALNIPVSIITDLDLKPKEYALSLGITNSDTLKKNFIISGFTSTEITSYTEAKKIQDSDGFIKTFIAPYWTLEYCIALCPGIRQSFFKSVLLALKEQKFSAGVRNFKIIDNRINNLQNEFNNWTDPDEKIAFHIYFNCILKKNISKAIIAQQFAKLIVEENIDLSVNCSQIDYLLDAIIHVTN